MQSYSASWKNIPMFFGKHQVFYKIMKSSSLYITAGKRGRISPSGQPVVYFIFCAISMFWCANRGFCGRDLRK